MLFQNFLKVVGLTIIVTCSQIAQSANLNGQKCSFIFEAESSLSTASHIRLQTSRDREGQGKLVEVFRPIGKLPPKGSVKKFRILSANLENWKLPEFNKKKSQGQQINNQNKNHGDHEKPLWAIESIAEMLLEQNAAVVGLQEILGKPDSPELAKKYLEIFNKRYLKGKYKVFWSKGNDVRTISVALLIDTAALPFTEYRLFSNTEKVWSDTQNKGNIVPMFSRNDLVVEARIDGKSFKPDMVFAVNHLKSQQSRDHDPNSRQYRNAQFAAIAQRIKYQKNKYQDHTGFVMGDFNTDVRDHQDFALEDHNLTSDVFDIAKKTVPLAERITEVFFPRNSERKTSQLDSMKAYGPIIEGRILEAGIVPFYNQNGQALPVPQSHDELLEQREIEARYSDHNPIFIDVNVDGLL